MEPTTSRTGGIITVAFASLIGTTVEWYDFFLYGTAAALVFGKVFFPALSSAAATLASLATFAVGFIARPVGGAIFAHYGDRSGRKQMLVIALVLMGLASTGIGLLPGFAAIGVWAPLLLVLLRFVQGVAVGGELGGAVLLATEHSPAHRRGFYGAWPAMGVPLGLLLSTVTFKATASIVGPAEFASWGWRVPFLLSVLLVAIGFFVRMRVAESPSFARLLAKGDVVKLPVVEVFRTQPMVVLRATGMLVAMLGGFYIMTVLGLSYGTVQLKMPKDVMLTGVLIGAATLLVVSPIAGAISDRIGRKPVFLAGAVWVALFAFPAYWLIDTRVPLNIDLGLAGTMLGIAAMNGVQGSVLAEMFDAKVRYSGVSMGYQLAGIVGGGVAPILCSYLLGVSGGASWPLSLLLIGLAAITLVSIASLSESSKRDL